MPGLVCLSLHSAEDKDIPWPVASAWKDSFSGRWDKCPSRSYTAVLCVDRPDSHGLSAVLTFVWPPRWDDPYADGR